MYFSDMMDKQVLCSAPCSGNVGRYGVGVFKEGNTIQRVLTTHESVSKVKGFLFFKF